MSAEARAEQLAIYSKRLLKRAADFALAHRANGQRPARIYTTRSNDGLETGLAGSIHSEVIELLGCHNVASATGHKGIARVSVWQWQVHLIQNIIGLNQTFGWPRGIKRQTFNPMGSA